MKRIWRVDGLQYAKWTYRIFSEMRAGGLDAVHATIAYHENFRETVVNIEKWNRLFVRYSHLIMHGKTADDIRLAQKTNRTAIIFGFQNPSPIEDDIYLVEIVHTLGARFMQLSYNNQSLLATGCYEKEDSGITRMGREVIREMNRVGLVVDMSHSGERSTLEAIEISSRPIAITHATPSWWHPTLRSKSDTVLKALIDSGGMLGISLYPHHLKDGSACTVSSFCAMVADAAERYGVDNIGIGSDLCQDQPDSVLAWMRKGRWSKETDYAEGTVSDISFPDQPEWFRDNRDFRNIEIGLEGAGFSEDDIAAIMGGNWLSFYDKSFGPEAK